MKSLVLRVTLLIGWAVTFASPTLAADEPAVVSLRLRNGDYVQGRWVSVESPRTDAANAAANQLGTIQWQASGLVQPLNVYWEQVAGIYLPIANDASTKPAGTHGFELATGDVLYGNLKSLSRESIEIESTRFGVLRMPTNSVRQLFTNQNAEVIVIGPQGTKGWYSAQPRNSQQGIDPLANNPQQVVEWVRSAEKLKQWSEQGPPTTNVVGAQLRSEFELPAKSRIEIELSWQKRGEFAIFVGGGLKDRRDRTAFRIEVWDKDLVLIREDDDVADVRTLMPINPGAGSVRLQLFHDRAAERLVVFSGSGAALADLQFKLHARAPGGKARAANNPANVNIARIQARNANNAGPNAQLPPVPDRTEANELVITNYQGDLRLDSIRVSAWSGVVPQLVDSSKPRLQRTTGQLEVGELISFDSAKKTVVYNTEQGERTESLDQFTQIVLSEKRTASSKSEVQLFLHDGTRLIGRPANSTAGRLRLRHASIEQEIEVPLADLQTISVALHEKALEKPADSTSSSTSVLMWDQGVLHGRLVDGQDSAEASCLVWHADAAQSPTALARNFSGRIVYGSKAALNIPATPQAATPNAPGNAAVPLAMVRIAQRVVANVVAPNPNVPAPQETTPGTPASASQPNASPAAYRIHLRSGEIIPCTQLTIDEAGLKIQSTVSTTNRLPNEQIKAVEMLATAKPPKLTKVKRQRLLMLPRVNRDNPPTHIVRSVDGDYLRGRLVELTDQQLTMEVRVETKQIPRSLVSHIIWVHADELDQPPGSLPPSTKPGEAKPADQPATKPAEKPAEKPATKPADKPETNSSGFLVQALRADGVRVGFEPREAKAGVIAGVNRYLGEVRVDVRDVDELLIGKAIGQAVALMPYSQWRWTAATLPKIVLNEQNSGDGSRKPGSDSPLVGKAAPDFKLPLLAGKEEFVLSQQKGRIVVLDFWATWCGPCLKTMPLLEKVVSELPKDAKVDLIAVNLEEQPRQITSMLERHKLKVTVALDQDGAVAAKYSATAIPQTVIVDREGKVVRLFVGGGPQFEKDLREALTEILGPPASNDGAAPAPKPVPID